MATVTDPKPFWEFDCDQCRSRVVAEPTDVRYAWFGANYGGDSREKRYFVPCPRCGNDQMLPEERVTDLVVSTAVAWERPMLTGDTRHVSVSAYTVSRLPDDSPNRLAWSIKVEAAGHGRWAVRHVGMCLTKDGEWVHEPLPSSRDDDFFAVTRWDSADEAIKAAVAAEATLVINGMTSADVLRRGG